jgi:uncharacterized membrane protein
MTANFPSNPDTTQPVSDDQIVQDLFPEVASYVPQNDSQFGQNKSAFFDKKQFQIQDFFNHPAQSIAQFWRQYKSVIITLGIIAIALLALNLVLSIVGFIVGIPLMGSLLELIGLAYSVWFVRRYLITTEARRELSQRFNKIKQDIIGATEDVVGDVSLTAKKSVVIQKSPEELYQFWRNFENLPQFMNHLESVKVLDDRRSHWIAKAPLNKTVEWDAEIIDQKENKSIVWKSLEGSEVDSVGSVSFTSANGSGTNVKVTLKYNPPAGVLGAAAASVLGENPQQQLNDDLQRFKQAMELSSATGDQSLAETGESTKTVELNDSEIERLGFEDEQVEQPPVALSAPASNPE